MRILLCLMLILASIPSLAEVKLPATPPASAYSRNVEIRAIWMDRRSIPSDELALRNLIRTYAQSGVNVVHPEVIYNGYSAYPSQVLDQQDLWNGLDVLAVIIDEAHKHHIEVHPWVWVFRAGNANDQGGILKKHPDWIAVDRNGNTLSANQGYWLCPSIPEVRQLLMDAFRELTSKYQIDGIELDYIRFETQSPVPYCYNTSCRTRFQSEHGIDPLCIEPFTKPVIDWHLWRENLINTFVAQVNAELKKIRPNLVVSAAVGSLPDTARTDLLQNWGHWADNKWVDFLSPMDYTRDPDSFRRMVQAASQRVQNKALLAPGIGLFLISDIQPVLNEIAVTREMPVDGVALFASAYLNADELVAFSQSAFRVSASVPVRSTAEQAKRLLSAAQKRLGGQSAREDVLHAQYDVAEAGNLLRYIDYRSRQTGYVPPSPPPIFIPEEVQPIPEVSVPVTQSPVIDGDLSDAVWAQAGRVAISHTNLGFDVMQPTDAFLAHDENNLYLAFRAHDPRPDKVRSVVMQHDGPVFTDDSIEMFLSGKDNTYYHFAFNAAGTTFEQRVFDPKWDGTWQVKTGREESAWVAEVAIPLSTIGLQPTFPEMIRGNFCRNRVTDGTAENSCWSATYGSYHTPIRFGIIHMNPSSP